jgi:hypothetical protein
MKERTRDHQIDVVLVEQVLEVELHEPAALYMAEIAAVPRALRMRHTRREKLRRERWRDREYEIRVPVEICKNPGSNAAIDRGKVIL